MPRSKTNSIVDYFRTADLAEVRVVFDLCRQTVKDRTKISLSGPHSTVPGKRRERPVKLSGASTGQPVGSTAAEE